MTRFFTKQRRGKFSMRGLVTLLILSVGLKVFTFAGMKISFLQLSQFLAYFPYFIGGSVLCVLRGRDTDAVVKIVAGVVAALIMCVDWISVVCILACSVVVFRLPEGSRVLNVCSKYSYQIMFLDSFFKIILMKILLGTGVFSAATCLVIVPVNIGLAVLVCEIMSRSKILGMLIGVPIRKEAKG